MQRVRHLARFDNLAIALALLTACSATLTQGRVSLLPPRRLAHPERVAVARPGLRAGAATIPARTGLRCMSQVRACKWGRRCDKHALKSALEQMPHPLIATIAMGRIRLLHPRESPTEMTCGRLDVEMVMIRHQAITMRDNPPALRRYGQLLEKDIAVFIVEKDILPRHTTCRDVVISSRVCNTQGPGHRIASLDECWVEDEPYTQDIQGRRTLKSKDVTLSTVDTAENVL